MGKYVRARYDTPASSLHRGKIRQGQRHHGWVLTSFCLGLPANVDNVACKCRRLGVERGGFALERPPARRPGYGEGYVIKGQHLGAPRVPVSVH